MLTTRQVQFVFEELPLIVADGFSAGLVNGYALIGWDRDGAWHVDGIALDGHRKATSEELATRIGKGMWIEKPVPLNIAETQWLYCAILDQLESVRFNSSITDAVAKARGEDRETLPVYALRQVERVA